MLNKKLQHHHYLHFFKLYWCNTIQKTSANLSSEVLNKISISNWLNLAFPTLFHHCIYIFGNINTFSRSWKLIAQFNTFLIPRENPATNCYKTPLLIQLCSINKLHSTASTDCYMKTGFHNIQFGSMDERNVMIKADGIKQNVLVQICSLTLWEPAYDTVILRYQPEKQQFSVALPMP